MKLPDSRLLFALALGLAVFSGACTHNREVRVKRYDAGPLAGHENPARLALALDPAFTNYTFVYSMSGDTFKFPMGSVFTQYATDVTRAACREVTVYSSGAEAAGKGDAILIPRVTRVNATKCAGFSTRYFLICVEWRLMDRDNRRLLWLETVAGQGEYPYGMSKGRERKMMQLGFDDLSRTTVQSLRESPTLAQLGAVE